MHKRKSHFYSQLKKHDASRYVYNLCGKYFSKHLVISVGLLILYSSNRYQVFSKTMRFKSYSHISVISWVSSFALIYKYQVLGIFKDHMLNRIVVYQSSRRVLSFAVIYKYQVLGIFKGHVLHIIVVYKSSRWVLSFALIYKYQLLGIFKGHALHIIVVYQSSR